MNKPESSEQKKAPVKIGVRWRQMEPRRRRRLSGLMAYVLALVVLLIKPLWALAIYTVHTELHSHILLVPFISAYLISIQSQKLPGEYVTSPGLGVLSILLGGLALGVGEALRWGGVSLSQNDSLALFALAFVWFLVAGGFLFLGRRWMSAAAFPVSFLFFLVPLPDQVVEALETASKLASAEVASWFFNLTGTAVVRDGVFFQLPGIVIEVAQECSGIRSSWVLLITSLVAAHLFLRSPWRRLTLVVLVIALGVLRNGFRILVIGQLCIRWGPGMIHSFIHTRGGPIFFALSLIPLFLLLWWLRRGERGR